MLCLRSMRPGKPRFSILIRALAALAVVLASGGARAQAVTNIVGTVTRLESDGTTSADALGKHPHPGGVPLNAVNFEDCAADLEYKFVLALTNTSSTYDLVAYVGPGDCTPYDARAGATPTCWPVIANPVAFPTASATTTTPVVVRVQDLASQASATTPVPAYPAATNSACVAQPTPTGASLWLYFFFVDEAQNAVGVAQAYPILVDTQAASATATITATAEESALGVNIPSSGDSDITGWNLYCDPPRGEETELSEVAYQPPTSTCVDAATASTSSDASDASTDAEDAGDAALSSIDASDASDAANASDAEADAASDAAVSSDSGPSTCTGIPVNDAGIPATGGCHSSTVFAASAATTTAADGAVVSGAGKPQTVIPSAYLCGQAAATDTSATISGLKDNYFYEIGLAATDAVGNIGPLATACGEPLESSDFYNYYYSKDGRAGGGYCSTDGVGVPGGTSALGVLAVAACAAIVRRRRRA